MNQYEDSSYALGKPATVTNNFFGSTRPLTQGTKPASMGLKGDLFDDPNNYLHGDLEQLSKEDFKERLLVAEKVMKQLFQRNKDLEDKMQGTGDSLMNKTNYTTQMETNSCMNCKGISTAELKT